MCIKHLDLLAHDGPPQLVLQLLLLLLVTTNPPLLLALELVVEEEERLLVRLGGPDDREHALAGLVVRFLSDRDFRAGQSSNLGDLGAIAADDAANHVGRDGDVLCAEVGGLW